MECVRGVWCVRACVVCSYFVEFVLSSLFRSLLFGWSSFFGGVVFLVELFLVELF